MAEPKYELEKILISASAAAATGRQERTKEKINEALQYAFTHNLLVSKYELEELNEKVKKARKQVEKARDIAFDLIGKAELRGKYFEANYRTKEFERYNKILEE